MADLIHVKKLREGVVAWNKWRKEHSEITPDLGDTDVQALHKNLAQIDFRHTNLDGANLHDTSLRSARLDDASFHRAILSRANLRNAVLHNTCFRETNLEQTNFYQARLLDTLFLDVDISKATNIEYAFHLGPSTIGIDTIQRSKGKISDTFLRGAGVSEQLIASVKASGIAPFDYCTCFISYSSKDERFANRLHQDLRKEGVLCWYAPESLVAGDRFKKQLTEAVQSKEKMLVVLSRDSLESRYVKMEVELALHKEKGAKSLLIPLRLDKAILNPSITAKVDWADAISDKRHILSFENWQQPSQLYHKQLELLLNALRKS